MFTSSMDFASENGFDTDDGAKQLWDNQIEMRGLNYENERIYNSARSRKRFSSSILG